MKFNKEKCKGLHGEKQLYAQIYAVSSFEEENMWVLVDTKLNRSQQCALAERLMVFWASLDEVLPAG